ncbi:hypothetical protein AB205_0180030 [Aquarana catesbeiana]|uniref:Uncharacterized protein n=1 Tax=Aquarana catesbeiana TaxID=8400 RepID=A0A2G9RLZ4_AQUCT|nr:hypothetical protein AB205_0180030 [Aquarana catesbeiana]
MFTLMQCKKRHNPFSALPYLQSAAVIFVRNIFPTERLCISCIYNCNKILDKKKYTAFYIKDYL